MDKIMKIACGITSKWVDKLDGGLADGKTPDDFDPLSLVNGFIVELEHVSKEAHEILKNSPEDVHIALEIAMDHLTEDSMYYTKLAEMEGNELVGHNKHSNLKVSHYKEKKSEVVFKLSQMLREFMGVGRKFATDMANYMIRGNRDMYNLYVQNQWDIDPDTLFNAYNKIKQVSNNDDILKNLWKLKNLHDRIISENI